MEVKVWTNGKPNYETGAGLGVRIARMDRDSNFSQSQPNIRLLVDDEVVELELAPSFWRKCHEIRHRKIGKWIVYHGLHKAPKGHPNKLLLERTMSNEYKLCQRK
ncbi:MULTISPECIES: hypothetical protein [Vibrio]|uniref:hypothetical protein n=1 Tax=Vibrio TaxID=662 RepID=UPI0006333233|nr:MULTISPECIES: hypothetical protein [Vibrio]CAH7009359.1 conserved hypothetical protein [Vibrio chagasii]TKE74074.1 hypothetical protein FCV54_24700 [Vibrio sp. F12]CAH7196959.1 conserved hypothetical protein [Vibrio chagasii]CAH7251274.1 conserved hypothetical protein [Vibrio chagasii]CAH7302647.1 conserved hypothetical protein [Vibrio chagasii]